MVYGRLFSAQLQERVELRLMKLMDYLQYTSPSIALCIAATSTQDSHGFLFGEDMDVSDTIQQG